MKNKNIITAVTKAHLALQDAIRVCGIERNSVVSDHDILNPMFDSPGKDVRVAERDLIRLLIAFNSMLVSWDVNWTAILPSGVKER